MVGGVVGDDSVDVGVDVSSPSGIVAWHINAYDVGMVVDGLMCEVPSYVCGCLMFLCVGSDSLFDEGDDPS